MKVIRPRIAILTDFGVGDNYNGVMEGVIKKINPEVEIIYISGNVKSFSIFSGAYLLYTSYNYFPKNTIFLVVVDPGVGTERKPIIIKTKNYIFVGPDNGVMYPAAINDGITKIIHITNKKLYLTSKISNTFHGRDIFSPVAAFISTNISIEIFGNEIKSDQIQRMDFSYQIRDNKICGTILYIDHFGNIAISIPGELLLQHANQGQKILTYVKGKQYTPKLVKSFGYGEEGELLIYSNGYFFTEIGINKGSAIDKMQVKEGDEICLEAYTQVDSSHSI
ncbi:hypothetical protein DJ526_08670 [Sulfolobus sp. A20-N-G8]|nr:hypothetical protein DJ526_08670 [Sulfolobus sp. A20-N-G8]